MYWLMIQTARELEQNIPDDYTDNERRRVKRIAKKIRKVASRLYDESLIANEPKHDAPHYIHRPAFAQQDA